MAQIIGAYDTNVKTSQSALKKVTATTSGTKDSLDVNITNASAVGGIEQFTDAYTIVGGDKGTVALGSDGTAFRYLKTDASGNLQVDVLASLPTGSNVIGAVTQSGTWDINDISGTISLPTGAATEATLSSIDTDTSTIATKVTDIETNTDALATVTKTTVGADTGLDVNVIKGINVEVDLSLIHI
jgi:hypothetical protein